MAKVISIIVDFLFILAVVISLLKLDSFSNRIEILETLF
jgi:hypothetical protein